MQLLTKIDVLTRTSLSQPTLYRQIKAGRFPKPVRISPRRVAWPVEAIEAWLEARSNEALAA